MASVNFVDEWVGRVYDALVETSLLETTWILWTSDHGDGQGDMFHWRKGYPYEFTAHVPMLLRWPDTWLMQQPAGSIVDRGTRLVPPVVTEIRDVFHTIVDAGGAAGNATLIPPPDAGPKSFRKEDGKSLMCLLRDPSGKKHCDYAPNPGPWRKWIDMEHDTCYNATNHWSALTDGLTKYIYLAQSGREQLFDLVVDPDETTEVSRLEGYRDALSLWRQRLVELFEANPVPSIKEPRTWVGEVFDQLDSDGSGELEFTEFQAAVMHSYVGISEETMQAAFHALDVDNSGTISHEELGRLMRASSEQVLSYMKQADLNGDGVLDFGEFKAIFASLPVSLGETGGTCDVNPH